MNISSMNQFIPFSPSFIGFLFLILSISIGRPLFYWAQKKWSSSFIKSLYHGLVFLSRSAKSPLILFAFLYAFYLLALAINRYYPINYYTRIINSLIITTELAVPLFLIFNLLTYAQLAILKWLKKSNQVSGYILSAIVGDSLKIFIFLILVKGVIPLLNINDLTEEIIEKLIYLLLIGVVGWIVTQVINGLEQIILHKISLHKQYVDSRKRVTQVRILKKIILFIALFIIVSSMLMVFDSVRHLGAGLLTTAGILGAAGAFASQRSLAGLFSGLKIAFTQPIAIGDKVIIENEFGQVEDITFSYVVIKLWDLRRLILPTDYFLNNSVLNLTRGATSELLGTVFFYVDYTIPVEVLREEFKKILRESTVWDKKTASFQVTELKEHSVEIRAVVGVSNGDDLWNLRCEVREKLLKFLVERFPNCLPKINYLTPP